MCKTRTDEQLHSRGFLIFFRLFAVEREREKVIMESGAVLPNKVLALSWHSSQSTGFIRRVSGETPRPRLRPVNCFWWPVHPKMKRGSTVLATSISVLVLLSLASQVSRCAAAAEGSAGGVSTERRRVRPYLQVQEQLHG